MEEKIVTVTNLVLSDQLEYNGTYVLNYHIEYPEFKSSKYMMCLALVNKTNKAKALELQKYCINDVYKMAVEHYKLNIDSGYPFNAYEVMQVYELTYNHQCILSMYFDRYQYTGGAHGNTIRSSQTWNLQKCSKIGINRLVRCPPDSKTYILKEVAAQIEKEPDLYFPNYMELIDQTYDESSFYCTREGIVVYYQQYDIAPYSSGIRTFLLPYAGCVADPARTCFVIP